MRIHRFSSIAAVVIAATAVLAADTAPSVVGDVREYYVASGDTLGLVAAKFGIEAAVLARDNGLTTSARLKAGDTLEIDNRHIVPPGVSDGIVINLPQRRLFVFRAGSLETSYPVAVGSGGWRTPTGEFSVRIKEMHPTWDVPKSIQNEMAQKGKPVLTKVAPGPDNPLGSRWIGLTQTIGIHGTNAPASIFKYATHGCIRMAPENVEMLFEQIEVGDTVSIIYQPVLAARDDDEVFVEVHGDPYKRGGSTRSAIEQALAMLGASDLAAHASVDGMLKAREGRARSLTAAVAASQGSR
ncbi:MAG: L,D-transpeptidase family protein [Acidobacteriota bacterium]|nr:L,D-transpeptidase family protein [Acidobacteriota bacterium]